MTAIEFIKALQPTGPWVITAINPEQSGDRTHTETFLATEEAALVEFIEKYNGKWNIYFTGNRVGRKLRKKPERTDIEYLDLLHIDLDPRKWSPETGKTAEEYTAEEQERILTLLTEKLPTGVPKPTVVVFSGGGYQAFWKLKEPLKLDGTLDQAEDAKLYNVQLERLFGADHCHNIDRIMRLPGTWNVPNQQKIKKGRKKVEAGVVFFDAEDTYDLSEFTKAAQLQSSGSHAGTSKVGSMGVAVDVSPGNIERLTDVHELDKYTNDGKPLPDRVKNIIQVGYDPDDDRPDAKAKGDRSVWVFDAVCAMLRKGIPDQVILSVLLDRDFRISDHVYDQKAGAEKYAIRQIERAKVAVIDPNLQEMNDKYAVTTVGGQVTVLWEDVEELYKDEPRRIIRYLKVAAIKELYCNRFVQVGMTQDGEPHFAQLGKWWFEHPNRRQFLGGVHFTPGKDFDGKFNLWRGFDVPHAPGNGHESFLKHIFENICSSNQEYYDYFINWLAHMIQKPAELAQVAIALRGEPGVGKSFVPTHVGRLLGTHFIQIVSGKHLVGNFNAHLQDKLFVLADESIFHGDKQGQSALKALITEGARVIERKGFDATVMPNYTRLILASNDEQIIHAQGHERRYFVLTVSPKHRQDKEYFAKIASDLHEGGYSHLLHFLLQRDISNFDPRNYPQTEELQRQKVMSLTPHVEWWLNCLQDGRVHPKHDGWMEHCPKDDAFLAYTSYMHSLRISYQLNKTSLMKHMREVLPGVTTGQRDVMVIVPSNMEGPEWEPVKQKKRVHCYLLPDLETCRKMFEDRHGKQDWGTEEPFALSPQ